MKALYMLLILFACKVSFGQELPILRNDTLFTTSGYYLAKGFNIKIGVGSTDDGDFKFIRINKGSVFKGYSANQSLANSANSFPRDQAGLYYRVNKIEARGNEKRGYVYYIKISKGMINYEVDIENAIRQGEVELPTEARKKNNEPTTEANINFSIADELKKLKGLLDEGVLSQEEFDLQKKKLLGQ